MTKMLKPLAAEPPSRVWEFFYRLLRYPFPMNHAYNPKVDRYLRTAINLGMVEWYGSYHLKTGNNLIWIQNYPYAYGTIATYDPTARPDFYSIEGRPSFEVIRRLRKLEKQLCPPEAPYPTL